VEDVAVGDMGTTEDVEDVVMVWKDVGILVEFIWFLSCFHFAHRSRERWQELTRQSFDFC